MFYIDYISKNHQPRKHCIFYIFRVFQKIEIILYNDINNKYVSITDKYIINLDSRSKAPAGLQKFKKAAAHTPPGEAKSRPRRIPQGKESRPYRGF